MTQLREKMREELERRDYAHRTAKTYLRIVRDFARCGATFYGGDSEPGLPFRNGSILPEGKAPHKPSGSWRFQRFGSFQLRQFYVLIVGLSYHRQPVTLHPSMGRKICRVFQDPNPYFGGVAEATEHCTAHLRVHQRGSTGDHAGCHLNSSADFFA
jgi:hypothetical protein